MVKIAWLFPVLCAFTADTAQADPVVPGTLRSYSTPQSIGVEWDVTGDADHDATALVSYCVEGTGNWQQGLPLLRIDSKGSNMLAGSLLFLRDDKYAREPTN